MNWRGAGSLAVAATEDPPLTRSAFLGRLEGLPVGLLPVRLVTVELALLPVEQVRELP